MSEQYSHKTVLLHEAVNALMINPDGIYIDGTFGRGGHSRLLLDKLSRKGRLIGIDKDPQAIKYGIELQQQDDRLTMSQGSFANIEAIALDNSILGQVDGILLDLGVSSPQLDDPNRGFSFQQDGPLDMRMDPSSGQSAAHWLQFAELEEITDVLKRFGEEKFGKRIATAIVESRTKKSITTTKELVEIVEDAIPVKDKHKHPATRTFQGIRIFINNELSDLEVALEAILTTLKPNGRMSIISFHSLEDRIVKRFIRRHVQGDDYPKDFPILDADLNKRLRAIGKAVKASSQEVKENSRSRSAVMRVAEKIK